MAEHKEAHPLRALEFFSGVGGWHYALAESTLPCTVVGAFELNPNANAVYAHNFPKPAPRQCNIETLQLSELDAFAADIWVMSPPCQPFTRLGKRKDIDDHRTDSCLALLGQLPRMQRPPRYLLLENVQGFEESEMRRRLLAILQGEGYRIEEFLLDPRQLGIPNARLRYYAMALRDVHGRPSETPALQRRPPRVPAGGLRKLSEFLEPEPEAAPCENPFAVPDKVLSQPGGCVDIVMRDSAHTTCFTKSYAQYAKGTGSIIASACTSQEAASKLLGWSAEEYHRFCAKDVYGPGHAEGSDSLEVPRGLTLLRELRLRYFTPREIANLMGFPAAFSFPDSVRAVVLGV